MGSKTMKTQLKIDFIIQGTTERLQNILRHTIS